MDANCHRLVQGHGKQSLMEWLTAAVCTVGKNVGKLPQTMNKCQSYTKLTQIIHEMGMRHAMLTLKRWGLDDESFIASMRDLILDTTPANAFGSLVGILAPMWGGRST